MPAGSDAARPPSAGTRLTTPRSLPCCHQRLSPRDSRPAGGRKRRRPSRPGHHRACQPARLGQGAGAGRWRRTHAQDRGRRHGANSQPTAQRLCARPNSGLPPLFPARPSPSPSVDGTSAVSGSASPAGAAAGYGSPKPREGAKSNATVCSGPSLCSIGGVCDTSGGT
jgi:hypothetical protein